VVVRHAGPQDARDVHRLAHLDSAEPLRGEVLLALVDGEPVAAVSPADGRVVADPFRPTADAAALLRRHARALRDGRTRHPALRLGRRARPALG
jgi:hypothetical protein